MNVQFIGLLHGIKLNTDLVRAYFDVFYRTKKFQKNALGESLTKEEKKQQTQYRACSTASQRSKRGKHTSQKFSQQQKFNYSGTRRRTSEKKELKRRRFKELYSLYRPSMQANPSKREILRKFDEIDRSSKVSDPR